MSSRMSNSLQLKNGNRISILNYIRYNRSITKAELAQTSGLTFMAIQKIIGDLVTAGLVREDNIKSGSSGRKSVHYTIDENYGYTLGLHINIFKTSLAVMNLHGSILAYKELDMESIPLRTDDFVDVVAKEIEKAIEQSGVERKKIIGLGIAAPGPVAPQEGTILSPPNLPFLKYLPICQIMEDRLKMDVLLCKDTNAMAMGEYWRGAGEGQEELIYVDADMGIGSGLIMMNRLQEGANHVAGEFGHITVDPEGPLCNCGNRGCLEAVSSGLAILKEAKKKLTDKPSHPLYAKREHLQIHDLLKAGVKGDTMAITILNRSAYKLGEAIATLINILDPAMIIMGGILVREYEPYLNIIRETALQRRLPGMRENHIVKGKCGQQAGVIGSGELVANHLFYNLINNVLLSKEGS